MVDNYPCQCYIFCDKDSCQDDNETCQSNFGGKAMGKMKANIKEVLSLEDSHSFAEVSKRKAKKIFLDIALQEKVLEVIENKGKVFATHEKNELVCYYIFERVSVETENARMDDKKKEAYAYKLIDVYWNTEKQWRSHFEKQIRTSLADYISLGMAKFVIWDEDVYVLEKKEKGAFSIVGLMVGAMLGWVMGISFDHVAMKISMMFMWAMIFNMLFTAEEGTLVKRGNEDATI